MSNYMRALLCILYFLGLGCAVSTPPSGAVTETVSKQEPSPPSLKKDTQQVEASGLMKVFGARSQGGKNDKDFVRVNVDCPGTLNQKCTYNYKPDELKKLKLSALGDVTESCRKIMAKDQKFKGGQLMLIFNLDKSGGAVGLRSISNESSIAGFDDCVKKALEDKNE